MVGLSTRQKLALNRSVAPINLWYGSVRSSKTFAQLWDFIARMTSTSGDGVNLIVGHSTNTVWRNFFQPILTRPEFEAVAPHLHYRRNAPAGTLFGKEFSVVGANNDASWISIQGLTILNAWGDEAVSWPESFWDMLLTRLSLPDSRLLVTCNPGTSGHYLKERVVDRQYTDPDIHVEKFLLTDNPTLSRRYVERLHRQYAGLFYRRMIEAEWVAAEGAVFESWNPDVMVTPRAEGTVLAVGIDYGTNHPTAGYALTVTDDGLQLSHEWSPQINDMGGRTRLTDMELADSLEEWLDGLPNQPKAIYLDPAAASFKEELYRRRLRVAAAKNKVVDGIRTLDSLFTNGVLTVAEECPRLINEIPGYRWDPKATERGNDAPIKEEDDHVDAARYAVFSSRQFWIRHVESMRDRTPVGSIM